MKFHSVLFHKGLALATAQENCTKRCLIDKNSDVWDCDQGRECNADNSVFVPQESKCTNDEIYSSLDSCAIANGW